MSDNELDNLFREAADGIKIPKDPSAWKDMSSRLDQAGVGTSVFWNWKTISSITAVAIISSSSFIWYASQKDTDQSIVKNASPSEQVESGKLKLNETAHEKAEPNSETEHKEKSALSSDTRDQKAVSGDKSIHATTEASNRTASSGITREPVHPSSQDGGDQKKATQQTESKTILSNTSTTDIANASETSQQKSTAKENQRTETVIIPAGAAVIKGSSAPEGEIASSNASAGAKGIVSETRQQKVTENQNQGVEASVIPAGVGVIKGSTGTDAKTAPLNTSANDKTTVSEASQQNSPTKESQQAGSMIIPAGVVASELNVSKTEGQNGSGDEKQTSRSSIEEPADSKSSIDSKSANQVTSNSPILTDSVVKPQKDLQVVAELTGADPKKSEPKEEWTKSTTALSIKLAVAPDFSSINYFSADGSGFNFGALVGYSFNNRWSVYSGTILSRKIYSSTEIDEPYTTSGGYPYNVNELEGDCRVIDIPINVYYTFFPEKSFSIKAGIGFTSYIMLSEEYTYYIDNPYGSDVYSQKIENENNEWFKMLNISMIVQKRLSNRFALELEPFLKAPLAGVGEGEVSLVSLGAFLNLRFDIPINKQKSNGE